MIKNVKKSQKYTKFSGAKDEGASLIVTKATTAIGPKWAYPIWPIFAACEKKSFGYFFNHPLNSKYIFLSNELLNNR